MVAATISASLFDANEAILLFQFTPEFLNRLVPTPHCVIVVDVTNPLPPLASIDHLEEVIDVVEGVVVEDIT